MGRPGKWSERDLLLSLALTAYEDSLCSGCGQPKDVAFNPDAEGWLEAREVVCAGCAARHRHGQARKDPVAGAKVYVEDIRPPGLELRAWSLPSAAPADADGEQHRPDHGHHGRDADL